MTKKQGPKVDKLTQLLMQRLGSEHIAEAGHFAQKNVSTVHEIASLIMSQFCESEEFSSENYKYFKRGVSTYAKILIECARDLKQRQFKD